MVRRKVTSRKPGLPGSFQAYTRGIKHIRVLIAVSTKDSMLCSDGSVSFTLLGDHLLNTDQAGQQLLWNEDSERLHRAKLHLCTHLKLA